MSEKRPDFDDLVGADLEPDERARLLGVHELLIAAGPPPELRAEAPVIALRPRRRRVALVGVAAAIGLGLFAAGLVVGDRDSGPGTFDVVSMTGTSYTTGLSASITIFDVDEAGNWPMELEVNGLEPSSDGLYELWLTRKGELAALCGSFRAEADGTTVVPMNAPYKLREFDGWVVVLEGSKSPLLST